MDKIRRKQWIKTSAVCGGFCVLGQNQEILLKVAVVTVGRMRYNFNIRKYGGRQMKPSFEVKMTQEALFEFLMFHTYHGIKGILYLVVGVACWIGAIISFAMGKVSWGLGLVFVFASLLLVIPSLLKFSAANQLRKSKIYNTPIRYTLEKDGLRVERAGKNKITPWKDMYRVMITPNLVAIYQTPYAAFIFPNSDIGPQMDPLKKTLRTLFPEELIEDNSGKILPFLFSRKKKK